MTLFCLNFYCPLTSILGDIDKQLIQKYVLHAPDSTEIFSKRPGYAYAGHLTATDFYETSIQILLDLDFSLQK